DGNIQCAGSNDAGPAMVRSVLAPASIVAGDNHVCAEGSDGVACRGWDAATPELSRPALLTTGNYHSCALDGESNEVICWGSDEEKVTGAAGIVGARSLAAGFDYSCALVDDVANCWGTFDFQAPIEAPALTNPV